MAEHVKLECLTNIPATVTVLKMFKDGENEYGKWFGYNVKHEGVEKSFFANEFVHDNIQRLTAGKSGVTIVLLKKEEKPADGAKKKTVWEVTAPGQTAPQPAQAPPPKPPEPVPPVSAAEGAYRERKNQLWNSLRDAAEVAERFNKEPAINHGFQLTNEDIRAIAIHFSIGQERKKGN